MRRAKNVSVREIFFGVLILGAFIRGVPAAYAETLWFRVDTMLMSDPDTTSDEAGLAPKTHAFDVYTEASDGAWLFGRVQGSTVEGWVESKKMSTTPTAIEKEDIKITKNFGHHLVQPWRLSAALGLSSNFGTTEFRNFNDVQLNQMFSYQALARASFMFGRMRSGKFDLDILAGLGRETQKSSRSENPLDRVSFTQMIFGGGLSHTRIVDKDFALALFAHAKYYSAISAVGSSYIDGLQPQQIKYELGTRASMQPWDEAKTYWQRIFMSLDMGLGASEKSFYGFAGLSLNFK